MRQEDLHPRYRTPILATSQWLRRSLRPSGGSSAYWSWGVGWSRAYPETTGYIIPTFLCLHRILKDESFQTEACRAGAWLLSIQNPNGSWNGGLYPARGVQAQPSIFNTGQILKGMVSLWEHTGDPCWMDAGRFGCAWLASSMGEDGLWPGKDYRAQTTPSYYTYVYWPMLEVATRVGDEKVIHRVCRGLSTLLERVGKDGYIRGMGFEDGAPAFTHTIAYTLRGFLECARLLEDWKGCCEPVVPALERLLRAAELRGGALPGAFSEGWIPDRTYQCLTGNAQVALCLMVWEARAPDLRIINGVAKLVDAVCKVQRLHPIWPSGVRGAVGGSSPLWGPYMRLRYPNWAAKYHVDALLRLSQRLRQAGADA